MNLIDPVSKSSFAISPLSKVRWVAALFSRPFIIRARKAARRSDWTRASNAYFRALRLIPCNGSTWVQLGHSLGQLDQIDAMQIAYVNATLVQPRLPTGHKHLGLVRYKTSLHDRAMNSLACALFLNPQDAALRDLMVGDEGEAKVEARMVVAALTISDFLPNSAYIGLRATIIRGKARAAARQLRWADAERLYRRLTRIRSDDANAFIQLGHALNEQKKHDEAEAALRCAVAASPLFADTWLHLGYTLVAREQKSMAREAFGMVIRLAPARREEHPIVESAAALSAGIAHQEETCLRKKLVRPNHLSQRADSIWRRLVTQIERKA